MTTTIKVQSHNCPAIVETFDGGNKVEERVLTPPDGEQTFYCTTTRQLRITDLEYEDSRVPKTKPTPNAA